VTAQGLSLKKVLTNREVAKSDQMVAVELSTGWAWTDRGNSLRRFGWEQRRLPTSTEERDGRSVVVAEEKERQATTSSSACTPDQSAIALGGFVKVEIKEVLPFSLRSYRRPR
jgi:hypothetical protein